MIAAAFDALDRAGFWVDVVMVGVLAAIAFADRLLAKKWSCAPEEPGPTRHRR